MLFQKVAIDFGTDESDEDPLPADNLLAALKILDSKEVVKQQQQQQQVKPKPDPQMSKFLSN